MSKILAIRMTVFPLDNKNWKQLAVQNESFCSLNVLSA